VINDAVAGTIKHVLVDYGRKSMALNCEHMPAQQQVALLVSRHFQNMWSRRIRPPARIARSLTTRCVVG